MIENRVLLLCVICSLSLCACDDDDDGIPQATHGVSGGKELNTLTQEEVDLICEDNRDRVAEIIDSSSLMRDPVQIGCTIAALALSLNNGTKAECESSRDQCIERFDRVVGDPEPNSLFEIMIELPCPPAATLAQCNVSVSEFDACTNAQLNAYQDALREANAAANELSCNYAGQPLDADRFAFALTGQFNIRIQSPEVCTSLIRQCPGVIVL